MKPNSQRDYRKNAPATTGIANTDEFLKTFWNLSQSNESVRSKSYAWGHCTQSLTKKKLIS